MSEPSDDRRAKLERLRDEGIEPYPHSFEGRTEIAQVREAHAGIAAGEETAASYRVAGRLLARREMGRTSFLDIRDGTGKLQLQARTDELGDESYEHLV